MKNGSGSGEEEESEEESAVIERVLPALQFTVKPHIDASRLSR